MLKESYDDHSRATRDFALNNVKYKKMDMKSGISKEIPAQDMRTGDII